MHIKQKIRGEHQHAQKKPEIMINDKPASAVFDELNEQRIQSQNTVAKDLARQ